MKKHNKKYNIVYKKCIGYIIYSKKKHFVVEWDFGNICNFRCSYCLIKDTYDKYLKNMTFEQAKKCVDFINSLPVWKVHILGGEPTEFKPIVYAMQHIKPGVNLEISTNGINLERMKEIIACANEHHHLLITVSCHYEIYLKDPEAYKKHLLDIVNAVNQNKYCSLEFMSFIDMAYTYKFKELLEWIYYEVLAKHRCKRFENCVSYIRRNHDSKECLQNYFMIRKIFDDPVRTHLEHEFKEERIRACMHNRFYHEPCPCFKNYCTINVNGYLISSDCNQKIMSKKSIFDDDFSLEEEQCVLPECCVQYEPSNSNCSRVRGLFTEIPDSSQIMQIK